MKVVAVMAVFLIGLAAASDSYTWEVFENKKEKGLSLSGGLSLTDAKVMCGNQDYCGWIVCKGDDMCQSRGLEIGKKKDNSKYTIYKKVLVDEEELEWHDFTKDERLDMDVALGAAELYYVRLPCSTNVHFKIFFFGEEELNGHLQWNYPNGDVYCRGGGDQSYYNGEVTNFNVCQKDCNEEGTFITLIIKQTSAGIFIRNEGTLLYSQLFGEGDGNCGQPTTRVVTQVWTNGVQLSLAAL